MDIGLEDKVAIITGGSDGIGKAAALSMAKEGANVVIVARRQEVLDQAVQDKRVVHVSTRYGYFNVVLNSYPHGNYAADNLTHSKGFESAGVHFKVADISSIEVTEGTDKKPCLSIKL